MVTFLIGLICLTLVVIGVLMIVVYNRLVVLKNRFINALSHIDVQLKRRYDLVPNLVESARAYLSHEKGTFEEIARLRVQAISGISQDFRSGQPKDLIQNDLALSRAIGHLAAVIESYPDLKADKTIANLMEDLSSVENRVSFARQAYNDAVMEYNQTRESFPAFMFASLMHFKQAWFWWAETETRSKPNLNPLTNRSA
ncbi:MAG: LemA family protein [Deltaproteobacteria bacterium]|nr:LemA family protein [Deltaproteobacteria bacterium]